ncbi:MAG: hypothetical protein P4L33_21570 [Capsulimonadaceae bacterium]|nr:hypothetical protein [Capsulimonadaceae bacterium]
MIFELNSGSIRGCLPVALVAASILASVGGSCVAVSAATDPAAVSTRTLACVMPLFEPAFTPGALTDAALQVEMTKLRQQIGENRGSIRVGFSGIFRGAESLRRVCRLARQNNLSVGVIIAVQTHSGGVAFDKKADLRQYQWRLDGKTFQGKQTISKAGNPEFPPRDWQTPTPSRYCAAVHESAMTMVGARAADIRRVMDEYPGVIVVVNCAIEEEMATGGESSDDQLADYSPFAVAEFRDWLRHAAKYDDATGVYKGQGAPEAIVGPFVSDHGTLRSPFYADASPDRHAGPGVSFNQRFGTHFSTWSLRDWDLDRYPAPIVDASFAPAPVDGDQGVTAGGFDAPRLRDPANPFWNAWSWDVLDHGGQYPPGNPSYPAFGFRQVEVKHFVGDVLAAAEGAGIPKRMLYAHQIPGEAVNAGRLRSGGDPIWTGWADECGTLGITRFGAIDPGRLTQYCDNWGIFEWHPAPRAKPDDRRLYDSGLRDVTLYFSHGAHVLFPGWWYAGGGHDPIFPLNDSLFANALKEWIASQP